MERGGRKAGLGKGSVAVSGPESFLDALASTQVLEPASGGRLVPAGVPQGEATGRTRIKSYPVAHGGRKAPWVATEEFWHWFKESEVVDGAGNPLLLAHGTKDEFTAFDKARTVDGAFHFGTPEQAGMRVSGEGKALVPVYLSIQNARRSRDMGGNWRAKIASARSAGFDGIRYLNRYEGIPTERLTALAASRQLDRLDRMTDAEFRKAVPEAQDSFIAFEATQVKSATGNSGSFDPRNPDLRA